MDPADQTPGTINDVEVEEHHRPPERRRLEEGGHGGGGGQGATIGRIRPQGAGIRSVRRSPSLTSRRGSGWSVEREGAVGKTG
jgi:hypothetical protein